MSAFTVNQLLDALRGLPGDAVVAMKGFSVYWRLRLAGRRAPAVLRDSIKCNRAGQAHYDPALVLEVDDGQPKP